MLEHKYERTEKAAGVILLLLSSLFIIRSFTLCAGQDIWYDELFTMEFVTKTFDEMLSLIASDVHPPLYYFIVRLGVTVSQAVMPQLSAITVAKAMSCIPYVLLLIYAVTVLRKEFGLFTAGLFSICIIAMPQMSDYTVEVRMYSWALFFVTAAAIHAFMIVKAGSFSDVLMLTIYSVAACYTHYYACIAIVCLYILLILWMILSFSKTLKQNNGARISFVPFGEVIVSLNVVFLSYLPWIGIAASQTGRVSENYWIQPLTIRSIGGCIKFLFKPAFTSEWLNNLLAVVLFAVFVTVVISSIRIILGKKYFSNSSEASDTCSISEEEASNELTGKRISCEFGCFCILIMAGLVAAGFLASFIIRPVFVYRYMLPACGVFWLGFAVMMGIAADNASEKLMPALSLITIIITVICIRNFYSFRGNELYKQVQMKNTENVLSEMGPDTKIVCNFLQVQALYAYYNGGCYLYGSEPEPLIPKMLSGIEVIEDDEQIAKWIDSGEKVIFLGSFNSREEILENWKNEYNISSKDIGSCMLERYWFDIYELS